MLAFHKASGNLRRLKLAAIQNLLRHRYVLAGIAGVTLAGAFPKAGIAGLAWVAPGLILMAALGRSGGQAFRIGYLAGLTHCLASLHWLLYIPFPLGAVAGWLALSGYLAIYPAVWVWLCWHLFPLRISNPQLPITGLQLIERFLSTSLTQRMLWTFLCAVAWVALEMLVSRFLTGFPWNFLGVSQYRILPVIQIASMTGVYGISFLVAWFSVALACVCLRLILKPMATTLWFGELTLPLIAVAAVAGLGIRQIAGKPSAERTLSVALVQPSIPQTLIWDPKESTNRFQQLIQLSELALAGKPDLLIWPEAAVPNMLRYEPEIFEAVRKLVVTHRVWLILGADDAEPRPGAIGDKDFDFYNSSFLINPNGEIVTAYRKQRLVLFGEYVPFVRWLPFLKYVAPIGDGFKPGREPVAFLLPDLKVKTSALICFEDTFPHLACEYVEPDTDFLVNLTNNGWFGESAAQWQHAAKAVFRAIENGLPLVRCANNGLTCWVDSIGGLHEIYFPETRDIYRPGFKTAQIPLLAAGQKRAPTFYQRHGDWFGWLCVGLAVSVLIMRQASLARRATANIDAND
jgi:apolipoprotein N-acyltransferase